MTPHTYGKYGCEVRISHSFISSGRGHEPHHMSTLECIAEMDRQDEIYLDKNALCWG
jgi:hypothetical protein